MSIQAETTPPIKKRRVSRRGPSTRAALIEMAIQLVAENGFEKTSVLEITQKLNISNGSFYYHFANIEELLQVVGNTVVDNFLDEIGRVDRTDPVARIACGVLIGLDQIDRNPKLQPIVLRVFTDRIDRHEDMIDHLVANLEAGKALNRFMVADTEIACHLVVAMFASAVRMKGNMLGDRSLNQTVASQTLMMLGIAAEEASQIVAHEAAMLENSGKTNS